MAAARTFTAYVLPPARLDRIQRVGGGSRRVRLDGRSRDPAEVELLHGVECIVVWLPMMPNGSPYSLTEQLPPIGSRAAVEAPACDEAEVVPELVAVHQDACWHPLIHAPLAPT